MNTTGEDGQKRKWQRIEKRKSERERERSGTREEEGSRTTKTLATTSRCCDSLSKTTDCKSNQWHEMLLVGG